MVRVRAPFPILLTGEFPLEIRINARDDQAETPAKAALVLHLSLVDVLISGGVVGSLCISSWNVDVFFRRLGTRNVEETELLLGSCGVLFVLDRKVGHSLSSSVSKVDWEDDLIGVVASFNLEIFI